MSSSVESSSNTFSGRFGFPAARDFMRSCLCLASSTNIFLGVLGFLAIDISLLSSSSDKTTVELSEV